MSDAGAIRARRGGFYAEQSWARRHSRFFASSIRITASRIFALATQCSISARVSVARLISQRARTQALAAAQARADASGQPEPVGFVARFADGSWSAVDGEVQPSSDKYLEA